MTTLKGLSREAPVWVIASAAVIVVAALVWTGWVAMTGTEGRPGPDKKVYPGMYDLRAEAAKRRAAENGAQGNAQGGNTGTVDPGSGAPPRGTGSDW